MVIFMYEGENGHDTPESKKFSEYWDHVQSM